MESWKDKKSKKKKAANKPEKEAQIPPEQQMEENQYVQTITQTRSQIHNNLFVIESY